MSITVTFLGTGTSQGVPVIGCNCDVCLSENEKDKRLRTSILVQWNNLNLVIDSGPDFRQQMLRFGVNKLDALIFTHPHKDHIAGMDDIRAFNFTQKTRIPIYTNLLTLEGLKRDFYYVFDENPYPGIPQIELNIIENKPFEIKDCPVIPVEVLHYKMPVLGFRFADFTYITDANYISEIEKDKIRGTKTLVLNALRKEPHISHFTLQEAIDLAKELGVERCYMTHISHQLGQHNLVTEELPSGIFLAYDGLTITV